MNPKSQWHIFCKVPVLEELWFSNREFFHSCIKSMDYTGKHPFAHVHLSLYIIHLK